MNVFAKSIAYLSWLKERLSTNLCPKCGDCFQLDWNKLKYDEILHSARLGYSPDRVERVVYSNFMTDAQNDLDQCQSELRRLEGLANGLKEQQELLLMYIAGVRSIMSPIHKLPEEILVEVFKYVCCEVIGTNCILFDNKKRLPTLTLSRVCIQWYNLVTSTPVLWSSFGTQNAASSRSTSLSKVFLERSHLHPIDFEVKSWFTKFMSISEIPTDSLACVVASANRWRCVNIDASELMVRAMLETLIACGQSLPALVSLNIKSEITDAIAFPIKCPNLKYLTLDEVALEFEAPLPAVTHLDLHGLNVEEAFRLIARCPNLQDITLKSLYPGNIALSTTSCIAQRLVIEFEEFPSFVDSLCNVTFPKLVHLVLSDWYLSSDKRNVKNLCPMLERSHRHLTHLSLCCINFLPGQLLPLFLSVPTVTVLDLEESPAKGHAPSTIYPALQALIAHPRINQREELGEDGDNDKVTLDSEDQLHEDGDEIESDDDDEDEESLDTEKNFQVPKGQCLLPRLKVLNLEIWPRNKLLLRLVRSRWRPSVLLVSNDDDSGSGACVCLQTLRMHYLGGYPGSRTLKRLKELEKSLYRFKKAGMVVEMSKWRMLATVRLEPLAGETRSYV